MFPCINLNDGALILNRYPASNPTYWACYNVDFKRQGEIKLFNEVRNGTVVYFSLSEREREKKAHEVNAYQDYPLS